MSGGTLRVGVVADTHGVLAEDVCSALDGSDLILHAGDIGDEAVLDSLRSMAPVIAVVGNGDPELVHRYPWEQRVEIGDVRILLCHWYDNFGRIHPRVAAELDAWQPHALVYGHTHEAIRVWQGDRLHFNPGYAGPPAAGRIRSVGHLRIAGAALEADVEPLGSGGP